MMRFIIVTLMSLTCASPAFGKTHNENYAVPCSQLWEAVLDTINNSGHYTLVLADKTQMSAAYNISGAVHSRTISVHLAPEGSNCQMQTQTSFSGLMQNDAGDFKSRVDQSLAKLKGAQNSELAKPPGATK